MFRNLRTSTKLLILCGVFIISIAVTTYGLVAEKQIAIDFVRKELAGTRYLATLRQIYSAVLTGRSGDAGTGMSADDLLKSLAAAQGEVQGLFETAEFEAALSATLRDLWSGSGDAGNINALVPDALAKARQLASRIADESNLALDPDLDTYYLQEIIVKKLPLLLGQLGEVQTLLQAPADATARPGDGQDIRFLVLDGLLQSTMNEIRSDLAAAYRGNPDGLLKQTVDAGIAAMLSSASSYLGEAKADLVENTPAPIDTASLDRLYGSAVDNTIKAWAVTQAELDRLLRLRIDGLLGRLVRSLLLIAALGGLSIFIAVMTHRYIVRPLERLEGVARAVRETKDYGLRTDYRSEEEIGRVAGAFDDMMAELASAREREAASQARTSALQAELASASRLTTMGAMAATIAHEINQPLAAIVMSGNAGLRWLANVEPDLDEARAALKRIVSDGHRASQVIATIRAMLKKGGRDKAELDVNELIGEVLALVHDELQNRQVVVEAELARGLPRLLADRVQLQQVVLNLVMNAADAMSDVTDRSRLLKVSSAGDGSAGVLITVADAGVGIDQKNIERIFDPFFTTKAEGMGLGLSICRSIIEEHGGHLSAARGDPHGSVFRVVLPAEGSRVG